MCFTGYVSSNLVRSVPFVGENAGLRGRNPQMRESRKVRPLEPAQNHLIQGVPNKIFDDPSDRPCKQSEHRYTPPHHSGDETFFIPL
jgi:hypothetical protein